MNQGAPAPPAVTVADCGGCRDDFYNDHNPLGVKRCWNLKDAKMVRRYRIHRDTMPATPGAFTEVTVPSCMNGNGWFYYKELPDFVRAEDVRRSAPARRSARRKPCGHCGQIDCATEIGDACGPEMGGHADEFGFEPGDL